MSKKIYEQFIVSLPIACSLHKLIKTEDNFPLALNFVHVNQLFLDLFHTTQEQVLEKRLRDLQITEDKTMNQIIEKCNTAIINHLPFTIPLFQAENELWYQIYILPLGEDYLLIFYTNIFENDFNFLQMDLLFQISLEFMCLASLDGHFIKVNAEFKNALGYEKEELEGNSFLSLIHPEDIEKTKKILEKLKNKEPVVQFINRFRSKNGDYTYIKWKSHPYGPYICSYGRDITNSKRLQEELTEKNRKLSKLTKYLKSANTSLRNKSITDTMTGLKNRGFFEERIEQEMILSEKSSIPLCMLIYDIDNFKKVNDTYGHLVGDEVIKQHAHLLNKLTRRSDIGFRMGGEEFALLMPNTSICDAVQLANRIRIAFEETPHPVAGKVTASFGVAQMHHGESILQWYQRIDSALYMAKSLGRNKVVSAEDTSQRTKKIEFHWNEKWNSRNEAIDREHRDLLYHLINLFNKAYEKDMIGSLNTGISDLVEFIIKHFDHEEQLLNDMGYPDLEAHKMVHVKLVKETLRLRNMYLKNEIRAFVFLSTILDDILLDHLVTEDIKYYKYIK